MRIRSTKPEFWRSERIASVDWEDRLLLKGLESYVDDNGVGKDDLALIAGDLFQRDLIREHSRTLARVSEGISRLHQAGLLWRYEYEGTRLLYIAFWESIQRVDKPQHGRFPRPDGTKNYKDSVIRECVANPREDSRGFAPGTGEQGNRGTGEQTTTARREAPLEPSNVVVEPAHIDNPAKPTKRHPSSGAQTVVRQVLGKSYPRTTVERVAIQVEKLAHEGHPDALIRQALTEWDQRADCTKPEFLPTVLGDVVKRSRARPSTDTLNAGEAKVAGWAALGQPDNTNHPKAINE